MSAKLSPPKSLHPTARVPRAGGEGRKLPDAQAGGSLVEIEIHRISTKHTNCVKTKPSFAAVLLAGSIDQDFRVTAQIVRQSFGEPGHDFRRAVLFRQRPVEKKCHC